MVKEDKPKKKYVPIAVTATKVGEVNGEDILKVDMPTNMVGYDDNKEENDNMPELTEAQVDKRVSELLGKLKLQDTIDHINKRNEEIDTKVKGIDEKFEKTSEILDNLKSNQEKLQGKQEEVCNGVDCVKKDFGAIDGKIERLQESTNKLNETVGAEYYKCSGPKGCNEDIKVGSSYCPNCGIRVAQWEGHPEWTPYWKRQK